MYDNNVFEQLIKSNLSSEQVYEEIIKMNPIKTKEKYSNDTDRPYAIYVGGIGDEDLVTVTTALWPSKMHFDIEDIYIDYIDELRNNLKTSDKSFNDTIISTIKDISKNWFFKTDTEDAINNSKLAQLYKEHLKSSIRQYKAYIRDDRVMTVNEDEMSLIYNMSKLKGTGNLPKCVDHNIVGCNLLNLSGFKTVLLQGNLHLPGRNEAHTFTIYKEDDKDPYNLLDCELNLNRKNVLESDIDFSKGVTIDIPITLTHKDTGEQIKQNSPFRVSPQKKISVQNKHL